MPKPSDELDTAYALNGVDDNRRLYRDWAGTYDDFVSGHDYRLHEHVAAAFVGVGGAGPVLDIGAGTGVLGAALAEHGVAPVDATDLSPEMLARAKERGVYRRLFPGNLLERLPVEDGSYAGAVSSGTFTLGHVGPEALGEVVRVVAPGGLICLSVNTEHWHAAGFEAALSGLAESAPEVGRGEVRIYGGDAGHDHADETCQVLLLRRR